MYSARGNFIDNTWIVPETTREWTRQNPAATTQTVISVPWSEASVHDAVIAAGRALPDWDRLGVDRRLVYLRRFHDALEARQQDLAQAITAEMGKPLWEARTEAAVLLKKIDIMTGEGLEVTAPVHPEGLTGGSWNHRPLGVLAVLAPFNFPLHLANGHIIPALATGNTVVVKPSEQAPASMQIYFQCIQEADFPRGVVNMVQGPGAVGAALSTHKFVNGVLFTGSYRTGQRIRRATLEQPGKLLALEMGGKNTTIVLEDADLQQAAHEILLSSCLTTGQRCSATSRVVAHHTIADELTDRLRALLMRVTTGDPTAGDGPFMGPLATEEGFITFAEAQKDDENGTLIPVLRGGAHPDHNEGYFVQPALWRAMEVDPDGTHQGQELFGPDIVLYDANDDAHATDIANATEYGLAMSVFTADEDRFDRMAYDLQTGILNLNRSTVGASSRLPFGGIKKSGNHRPAAILAGRYCTYPQASLRIPAGFDENSLTNGPFSKLDPSLV